MKIKLNFLIYIINRTFNYINIKCYSQSKILFNKLNINSNNWKEQLDKTMQIFPNFITIEEEISLTEEIDPYIKKLRYEQSHWDDVSIMMYIYINDDIYIYNIMMIILKIFYKS